MSFSNNASATFRFGIVCSVDIDNITARVRVPDLDNLVSWDLQVLQRKARKDRDHWLPDIREEVACLFAGNGLECGVILGAVYNAKDLPPVKCQDKRHVAYSDGSWTEYDRAEHKLKVHSVGTVDLFAKGDINITSETGNVWINGVQVHMNSKSAPANCAASPGKVFVESEEAGDCCG